MDDCLIKIMTSGNPCLQGTTRPAWHDTEAVMTPKTLKLNDILPFQKVMTMGNWKNIKNRGFHILVHWFFENRENEW
jgi:hypothetical protein